MLNLENWRSMLVSLILVVLAAASCTTTTPEAEPEESLQPTQVILKISGSGSTVAILDAIQDDFETDTPGYTLEILPGSGSGGGVEGIINGQLDVATMARPPKEEEAAQDVEFLLLGQGGVGIITHADIGELDLTTDQVKAVFSGEVTNWSELGGADQVIILYVRDEGDSSTVALRQTMIGDVSFSDEAQVLTSEGDMLTAVAGTPGSIGIATWPTALARGDEVRAISVDGVSPGDAAYPMVATLGIGYLTARQSDVQPLIDWLISTAGQEALDQFEMIISQ